MAGGGGRWRGKGGQANCWFLRCTRNCFSCPICFAALSVTAKGEDQTGPFILLCSHCLWSTQDIGIEFDKPTSITTQLAAKLKAAAAASAPAPPPASLGAPEAAARPLSPLAAGAGSYLRPSSPVPPPGQTDEAEFARLRAHYNQQREAANADDYPGSGSLSRLMGLYSTSGGRIRSFGPHALHRQAAAAAAAQPRARNEWQELEPCRPVEPGDDDALIARLRRAGLAGTTSYAQRAAQPHRPLLLDGVRPVAALLRTKRAKRCRSCRHILVKPESKLASTRYRIKLVAG